MYFSEIAALITEYSGKVNAVMPLFLDLAKTFLTVVFGQPQAEHEAELKKVINQHIIFF